MLDDESSAEKSVDDKFYDVLNSSFASSSVEHLMDRVSKMSPPGNNAICYCKASSVCEA